MACFCSVHNKSGPCENRYLHDLQPLIMRSAGELRIQVRVNADYRDLLCESRPMSSFSSKRN